MDNNLKDILSNSNKDIDNQELLNYLSNQLSQAQAHEVEKAITDDAFMNDAVEGLQQISNQKNIPLHLEKLNESLQQQLAKKKDRRKRRWKDNPQTYLIIVLILLLLMLCYIVVKQNKQISTSNHLIKQVSGQSVVNKSK